MNNGQGTGDTESGTYTILGGSYIPSNGTSITRNLGASWFLTNEKPAISMETTTSMATIFSSGNATPAWAISPIGNRTSATGRRLVRQ